MRYKWLITTGVEKISPIIYKAEHIVEQSMKKTKLELKYSTMVVCLVLNYQNFLIEP